MTAFLKELEELFNTFQEDESKRLKLRNGVHDSLLQTLMESEFFMKEYIKQELLNNNGTVRKRFTLKTYYDFRGYPVKLNTTKKMEFDFKVKKDEQENFSLSKLKKIKVEELVLSTEGSRTRTQFECWTPMEMFLWWRTLRESSDSKREWKIMDAVFFLFINQLSQIINTYVINFRLKFYSTIVKQREKNYRHSNIKKYKIKKYHGNDDKIIDPYLKSLFYLKKYLEGLDKFYASGGEYGLLLDVQLLYYEFYEFELYLTQLRHADNNDGHVRLLKKNNNVSNLDIRSVFFNNKKNVNTYELQNIGYKIKKNFSTGNFKNTLTEYANQYRGEKYNLKEIFRKTLEQDNFTLVIFQSYFQNPSKFISLYSIPVIPILGIEYDTHGGGVYSSIQHVHHDLFHAIYLRYFLNHILYHKNFNKKSYEDIQEFFIRTLFLEELNRKALNKNNNEHSIYKDAQKLLWWILHEKNFDINNGGGTFNVTPEKYMYENKPNPAVKNFFYIDKLKELLGKLNGYTEKYSGNDRQRIKNCISKLLEICEFVLRQNLRYNYRNENNNRNNRRAIYGNIKNNNKVNEKVDKYLKKHQKFTNNNLQGYANNYKIGKIYNTNNENNISRFKVDFIKRVKEKQKILKISKYIANFIKINPTLTNNNTDKLEKLLKNKNKLEKLKEENPKSSNIELLQKLLLQNFSSSYSIPNLNMDNNAFTKKQTSLRTLSKQRNAFVKGIVNNPNGSPLNNNNFSNQPQKS